VLARLAGEGEAFFDLCRDSGAVDELLELSQGSGGGDLLLQLSCLELVSAHSCATPGGLDHLCKRGLLLWLIDSAATSAIDPLIEAEAMRCLGAVFTKAALLQFDLFQHIDAHCLQRFLAKIQHWLEEGPEANRVTALVLISDFVCISLDTMQLVVESPALVDAWVGLLRTSSRAELTAAILHSIAKVLEKEDSHFLILNSGSVVPSSVLAFVATSGRIFYLQFIYFLNFEGKFFLKKRNSTALKTL
jgi:hypothetical protein